MTTLERHRALLAAATARPWHLLEGDEPCGPAWGSLMYSGDEGCGFLRVADAELSVSAVNLHPLLLDLWAAAKECSEAVSDRSGGPIDRMRDILAKLEAKP